MGIASYFKNRGEEKFIDLLIQQAHLTVEGLELLLRCVRDPSEETQALMKKQEYAADEVRRVLIDELHKTFITPLDREDIFNLSLHIDEMLDYALTTVEAMVLLNVSLDEHLEEMLTLNSKAAVELEMAMQRLKDNPRVAGEHALRARKLENEVDNLYRVAVASLFTKAKDFEKLLSMMRRREVYRHVSNMSDRASMAAHVIGMVVMKLT